MIDSPEFIMVDEMGIVVQAVATKLGRDINYQYGYIDELDETLQQFSKNPTFEAKKYPLVWLMQPFTISRGELGWFGTTKGMRMLIIQQSNPTDKATARMANNFKTVLYPIYRELLKQMVITIAFDNLNTDTIEHDLTDRYYWGEEQQRFINDVFDCMDISNLKLKISNKQNTKALNNF